MKAEQVIDSEIRKFELGLVKKVERQ